jgi:hypothetical protein
MWTPSLEMRVMVLGCWESDIVMVNNYRWMYKREAWEFIVSLVPQATLKVKSEKGFNFFQNKKKITVIKMPKLKAAAYKRMT